MPQRHLTTIAAAGSSGGGAGHMGSSLVSYGLLVHTLLSTSFMNNIKSPLSGIQSIRKNGRVSIYCRVRKFHSCMNPYTFISTEIGCASVFSLIQKLFLPHLSVVMDTEIKRHLLSPSKAV